MGENQAAETLIVFKLINVVTERTVITFLCAHQGYPKKYQFYLQQIGFMFRVRKNKLCSNNVVEYLDNYLDKLWDFHDWEVWRRSWLKLVQIVQLYLIQSDKLTLGKTIITTFPQQYGYEFLCLQFTVIHASKWALYFNISHNFRFFGGVAHLLSYNISHVI